MTSIRIPLFIIGHTLPQEILFDCLSISVCLSLSVGLCRCLCLSGSLCVSVYFYASLNACVLPRRWDCKLQRIRKGRPLSLMHLLHTPHSLNPFSASPSSFLPSFLHFLLHALILSFLFHSILHFFPPFPSLFLQYLLVHPSISYSGSLIFPSFPSIPSTFPSFFPF